MASAKGEARKVKAAIASEAASTVGFTTEEKLKKMAEIAKAMNKAADRTVLFRAGEDPSFGIPIRIASNIPSIDRVTGGGLPRGMVTEIFGGESAGKTTLALHFMGQAQKQGGVAAYIDAEHTFDRAWAMTNGVDVENLFVLTPSTAEEGLQAIIDICKVGAADVIILDSVVALATVQEKGRELTDENIARLAAKLSQFFKMSISEIARSKTAVIMINQLRTAIGTYGAPEKAPGGNALKHYKALSILVKRGSVSNPSSSDYFVKVGSKYEQIGFPMDMKIQKTKIGGTYAGATSHPSSTASVDFWFGSGLDTRSDIVNTALKAGLPSVQKSGTWFEYAPENGEKRRAQGKDAFMEALTSDDMRNINEELLAFLSTGVVVEDAEED